MPLLPFPNPNLFEVEDAAKLSHSRVISRYDSPTNAVNHRDRDRGTGSLRRPSHSTGHAGPHPAARARVSKSLNNSQRHNELTDGRRPVSEKPDMRADRNTYLLVPFGPSLTTWADYDALC